MNPNFVSGLVQADGYFFIAFEKRKKSKYGLRVRPKCSLTLDLASRSALEAVQEFFKGIGKIYENTKKHSAELAIDSLDQLRTIIIPHFYQYPLYGTKQHAFLVFVDIVNIIQNKEHYKTYLQR